MILPVQNQAFAALNALLALPGSTNLGAIDLDLAVPTLPLLRIMEAGLAEPYQFDVEIAHAGADDTTVITRPWVVGDWTDVFLGLGTVTEIPEALLAGHDWFITRIGAHLSAGAATLTSLSMYTRTRAGGATARELLWFTDSTVADVAYRSTGSAYETEQPIVLSPRMQMIPSVNFVSSGAATARFSVSAIRVPVGLISRIP